MPFRSSTVKFSRRHRLVYGVNPFTGLTISTEDLRRECETLVKGHLVHLRENYVECRGRQSEVAALVADAAPAFALILRRLARLDGSPAETHADLSAYAARRPGLDPRVVGDLLAMAGDHNAGVDADSDLPVLPRRGRTPLAFHRRLENALITPSGRRFLACLVVIATFAGGSAFAQTAIPELTAPVNDFAGVIDSSSKRALESLVRQLQNATGDVLVVATVKTFQPYPDMPSYAVKMFENHGKGIGAKGTDNGVLLLLAIDDRQVRIEPGYGLEGFITDGFAGETSRAMAASFRNGDYGGGLVEGATRVAQRIADGRDVQLVNGQPLAAHATIVTVPDRILGGALHHHHEHDRPEAAPA